MSLGILVAARYKKQFGPVRGEHMKAHQSQHPWVLIIEAIIDEHNVQKNNNTQIWTSILRARCFLSSMGLRDTWALLSEDRNRPNVCFNKWVRAMTGTKWSEIYDVREKRLASAWTILNLLMKFTTATA